MTNIPISIDGWIADVGEFDRIKHASKCINCYKPYKENDIIIFTSFADHSISWWHKVHCDTGINPQKAEPTGDKELSAYRKREKYLLHVHIKDDPKR